MKPRYDQGHEMPYRLFCDFFPGIAKAETRSITVFEKSNLNLSVGDKSRFNFRVGLDDLPLFVTDYSVEGG